MRFFVVAIAFGLAGCGAGHLVESLPQPAAPQDLSEPDYRQIVADNIATVFPNPDGLGSLEISAVRPVDHLRGPAWLACLKIHADEVPQEYALFIQDGKIVDQRTGVVLDRCKQQAYQPFGIATYKQQKRAGH